MTEKRLPQFQGKPLIENPEVFPHVGFLEGAFGQAFLEKYNRKVRRDYAGNSHLDILNYSDGVVKGSNPFAVVLANMILKQEGLRTASQADLEKIIRTNTLDLTSTLEDTALVLKKLNPSNRSTYASKKLIKQIEKRGKKVGSTPLVVPLNNLRLVNDSNAHYELSFNLMDISGLFYAPILSHKNDEWPFLKTNRHGLPEIEKGNRDFYIGKATRELHTGDFELSVLSLYWGQDIYSDSDDFIDSGNSDRIVVVKEAKK